MGHENNCVCWKDCIWHERHSYWACQHRDCTMIKTILPARWSRLVCMVMYAWKPIKRCCDSTSPAYSTLHITKYAVGMALTRMFMSVLFNSLRLSIWFMVRSICTYIHSIVMCFFLSVVVHFFVTLQSITCTFSCSLLGHTRHGIQNWIYALLKIYTNTLICIMIDFVFPTKRNSSSIPDPKCTGSRFVLSVFVQISTNTVFCSGTKKDNHYASWSFFQCWMLGLTLF